MLRINNEEEKYLYFKENINKDGAYFNVKYSDNDIEFVWVTRYKKFNQDGTDYFLEAPNYLRYYQLDKYSLEPYYDEEEDEWYKPFEWCYIQGNRAYEIESPQTSPFLPGTFEIEFVTDDEETAVKYLLEMEGELI